MTNIIKIFWINIKNTANQDYQRHQLKDFKSENFEKQGITGNDTIQQDIVSIFIVGFFSALKKIIKYKKCLLPNAQIKLLPIISGTIFCWETFGGMSHLRGWSQTIFLGKFELEYM